MSRADLLVAVVACGCAFISFRAGATTIHVDWAGGGDYLTIQEGIDAATFGDTVLVAAGTYREHLYIGPDADGMTLLGEAGPDSTIVDNENTWPHSVLVCESVGENTLIQGFAFAGGYTPERGGGIRCYYADPRIVGNIVRGCWSVFIGGGISTWGSNVQMVANTIRDNQATDGGGISVAGGETLIHGNTIVSNKAQGFGGSQVGGGIYVSSGTHSIVDNLIEDNWAVCDGAGICLEGAESTLVHGNTISHNSTGYFGGGLDIASSSLTVSGNLCAWNTASLGAAAVQYSGTCPPEGCLFYDNVFYGNGGGAPEAILLRLGGRHPGFHSNFLVDDCAYEVRVSETPSADTLDFTGNWWGTSDPDSIAARIHDCNDDPALLWCVDFSQWCADPSCNGQVTSVPDGGSTSPVSWGRLKAGFK